MKNTLFPKDDSRVKFTDMQGIEREGMYKKDSNGYVEILVDEMPEESKYLYPEDEIVEWKYLDNQEPDMTKFVL